MNNDFFKMNLLSLEKNNPELCSRLSSVKAGNCYFFLEARSGEIIPALQGSNGASLPLHSTVDPRREGERLVSALAEEGYLVFLGLGGAFAVRAALEREATKKILIIEYDCSSLSELLKSKDYTGLFRDKRVRLLIDPSPCEIEAFIVNNYLPALDGGIHVFPLRVRTDGDNRFSNSADAVRKAIEAVIRDYSVQAYFGKRWFCNIIRNLFLVQEQNVKIASVQKAIICAAGPSLEEQLPEIKKYQTTNKKEQKESILIATDTSLPVLLQAGIEPKAVISMDCQHISYRHFFNVLPEKTTLFLDLASPPLIASRAKQLSFFSGGHPFSLYAAQYWRSLPILDTSGANVTFAALSLAENLGAREISLYGADFSYPRGKTYARGAYIYPFFENIQSRYMPLEAQHSAFLYRDSSIKKICKEKNDWYYETTSFEFYRKKVKEKEKSISGLKHIKSMEILPESYIYKNAREFLTMYRKSIENIALFNPSGYNELETTLLPLAAYIRKKNPLYGSAELFNAVKSCCLEELNAVLVNQN